MNGVRSKLLVLILLLCVPVAPALAQRTHALVIAGLSGDPSFKARFAVATKAAREAAKNRWGVADSSLIVLTEDSTILSGRSSRENIGKAFLSLSRRVQAGDVLLVLLMGHGSGEGAAAKVNLPGPDATAAEYAAWLSPFASQQVVFVNTATGSGDFVQTLAAPQRVIVTATRSSMERNDAEFLQHFTAALNSDDADADKDGRLSVLEAFRFARGKVAKSYERTNRMLTEHAVLSDSVMAARITLGSRAGSSDPRVGTLLAERQALESSVAALRTRKREMPPAAYEAELERLLLAIAEKTQAIRAAGGGK